MKYYGVSVLFASFLDAEIYSGAICRKDYYFYIKLSGSFVNN